MDSQYVELIETILSTDGPIILRQDDDPTFPTEIRESFSVRSMMVMAIRPRVGQPWALGIHQCSHVRRWSGTERRVFTTVGRRIGDALGNLVLLRSLQEKEERLRLLADGLPGVIYGTFHRETPQGTVIERQFMSHGIKEILGERLGGEVMEDVDRYIDLVHPEHRQAFIDRAAIVEPGRPIPDMDYQVRTDSGEYAWVRSIVRISRLADDLILRHGIVLDVSEQRRAEQSLHRTQFAVEKATDAVFWIDHAGKIIYVNDAASRTLGYTREELLDMTVWDFDPTASAAHWPRRWEELAAHGSFTVDSRHRRKDGTEFPVEIAVTRMVHGGEEIDVAFARDATARKEAEERQARLESQLQQAQKMEAVGQLAGGIAHDFNNILTAILGHGELALGALGGVACSQDQLREELEGIVRSARRAAALTNQLLVIGRRDVAQVDVVDLTRTLGDMREMLRRMLGAAIEFEIDIEGEEHLVLADRGQLEQVVMNLVINAQDAMPRGGRLELRLTSDRGGLPEVVLEVSDTGSGMTPEVAERIFEPFFTTKPVGRGSGLGLAVVYGIVQGGGGVVEVESERGRGSTFRVRWPAADPTDERTESRDEGNARPPTGSEVLLVCEDDAQIREMTSRMLAQAGYQIMAAENSEAALRLVEELSRPPDLLLTDLVMPGMNGRELSEELSARSPGIRTLFISGYAAEVLAERDILEEGRSFLAKPFTRDALLEHVRMTLDGPPPNH
jgi:PAS domain S-box-containing protein